MQDSGSVTWEKGGLGATIAGRHPTSGADPQTVAVVYHLRGGSTAQTDFFERQMKLIKCVHSINMIRPMATLPPMLLLTKEGAYLVENSVRCAWLIDPDTHPTDDYDICSQNVDLRSSAGTQNAHDSSVAMKSVAVSKNKVEHLPAPPQLTDHTAKSLDTSTVLIQCRCGTRGVVSDSEILEDIIQCSDCQNWSHRACQPSGYTAELRPTDRFICDACNLYIHLPKTAERRASERYALKHSSFSGTNDWSSLQTGCAWERKA